MDDYCAEKGIRRIDLLKVDAEGSDLSILLGAPSVLPSTRAVLAEITFENSFAGGARYHETLRFLDDRGFRLAGLYDLHYRRGVLHFANGLFIRAS